MKRRLIRVVTAPLVLVLLIASSPRVHRAIHWCVDQMLIAWDA